MMNDIACHVWRLREAFVVRQLAGENPLMPSTPPRRWFQFRLRTLLIAVAVLAVPCAWVGYSLRWIGERHRLLEDARFTLSAWDTAPPTAPAGLWLFGEQGATNLMV